MKRLLYFVYYLRKLNKPLFRKFVEKVKADTGRSTLSIYIDIFKHSLRYNVSILEYFQFHFYEISDTEKETFAGTGYMFEYQRLMNPVDKRAVLSDKIRFLDAYSDFVIHHFATADNLKQDQHKAQQLIQNTSGKLVLKSSDGQCGDGIEVRDAVDFSVDTLVKRLDETGNDFVEEFVVQHDDIMALSPSGLNTLRIITQLNDKNEVEILGARLRISVGQAVDNLAAGNIAAPVDLNTGRINGLAVYSDITKEPTEMHPITQKQILGFQVPFWKESLQMVKDAALLDTSNRSIGWDVAVTNIGPELIEGNHDWCKLLWQLPAQKGLKPLLEKHKTEYLKHRQS